MKWRSTAIYLLVLLLIGGIYLAVSNKQKQAAREEKQSRLVLSFNPGDLKEIEIRPGNAKPIHLEKGDKWKITQPIASDIDKAAFAGFFTALHNIEMERKIGKPADNPAAFGLDKPSLVVRLLAGSGWLELDAGGENPSGASRYARAGEGGDVFMMSGATYKALNMGLNDLRSKELFSWLPDQVASVDVKWRGGEEVSIDRQGDTRRWKSSNRPDVLIKPAKVHNLLEELQWLRAAAFDEKTKKDALPSGAIVDVKLKLKDGKTSEFKVGDPDQEKKMAMAVSSDVEGSLRISSLILGDIPKSVSALADVSLVSAEAADVREITWKTGNGSGDLVWMDAASWGTKQGNAAPKAVEDPRQIRVFLAGMENADYMEAVEPSSNPPEGAPNYVQIVDAVGKKSSITWDKLPETPNPVAVWLEREGAPREVKVQYGTLKRLDQSLAQMAESVKVKQKKE